MIITSVLRSKQNRGNVQQRIIAGMSVCDLVCALVQLTGPLWFPGNDKTPGLGNDISCSIGGFILVTVQFATILYNDSLALYYLLIIKFNCSERRLKFLEKWFFHSIPIVWGFIISILAAATHGLNVWPGWSSSCGVKYDKDEENSYNALYITCILTGLIALLFNITCLIMVYVHVRREEKKLKQFRMHERRATNTRLVAKQCLLYFMVIFLPWIFMAIFTVLYVNNIHVEWLDFLKAIFVPTAGFLNGIVYFRLRYGKLRKQYANASQSQIVLVIIGDKLFPCCSSETLSVHSRSKYDDDGMDLEPSLFSDDDDEY